MFSQFLSALLLLVTLPVTATWLSVVFLLLTIALPPDFQPALRESDVRYGFPMLVLFSAGLSWVLFPIYVVCAFRVYVARYPRMIAWMLGLTFLSGVAMPLFWYLHLCPRGAVKVRREPITLPASPP